jgi:hypothetical protein
MTQNLRDTNAALAGTSIMKTFLLFGIVEAMKSPGGQILVDKLGDPARPDVEDVPYYYTKESQERLAKAQAKRERKNRKRLKNVGMV